MRWVILLSVVLIGSMTPVVGSSERLVGLENVVREPHFYNAYPYGDLSQDGKRLAITEMDQKGWLYDLTEIAVPPMPLSDDSGLALAPVQAISGDGHTAVGSVYHPNSGGSEAVVWRDSGEIDRLGFLSGELIPYYQQSYALDVSQDGSVIVGSSIDPNGRWVATIWEQGSAIQRLPLEPNATDETYCHVEDPSETTKCNSEARGVSGNGEVVVGSFGSNAFVWDAINGTRILGSGGGSSVQALEATAISRDGTTVVGRAIIEGVKKPFVWSESTGLVEIDYTDTGLGEAFPLAVSADGSVVVGQLGNYGFYFQADIAFIWTREGGLRDLRLFLESRGVTTEDWWFFRGAWAVSDDGKTIAGTGNRTGVTWRNEAFVVTLPPPEVSTGVGLCELTAPNCIPFETIARTSQIVPGQPYSPWHSRVGAYSRFSSFDRPSINSIGEVAFEGRINEEWTWAIFGPGEEGSIELRVMENDPALVIEGGEAQFARRRPGWFDFAGPVINEAGDILFVADVYGDGIQTGNERGVWRSSRSTPTPELIAQSGGNIPQLPNEIYDAYLLARSLQIDIQGNAGFTGFTGFLVDSGSKRSAIFHPGDSGSPVPILRLGDPAPGLGDDLLYSLSNFPQMNQSGHVAFSGWSKGIAVDSLERGAIWASDETGELALVVRHGDSAPGLEEGTTFILDVWIPLFQEFSYTDDGNVVFVTRLEGPEIGRNNDVAYWKWRPDGQLELLLREGDPVPGMPGATYLGDWWHSPIANNAGVVVFEGYFLGPGGGSGYWKRSARGKVTSLLMFGQQAPHLPAGVLVAGSASFDDDSDHVHVTSDPVLNEIGSTLLDVRLEGAGVDETNDRALYLVDGNGEATLALRTGDSLEVAPELIRTVRYYKFANNSEWWVGRTSLSDRNEIAVTVDFLDGTDAVIVIAAPEPNMCVDTDGDGFGAPGELSCTSGPEDDCDDLDATSAPFTSELCDGRDNDCDGVIPADELDSDGDGYSMCEGDCRDSDNLINPAAVELPGNDVDENCDGSLGRCDPNAFWRNHGSFVRCVADRVKGLRSAGLLSAKAGRELVWVAARSEVGK